MIIVLVSFLKKLKPEKSVCEVESVESVVIEWGRGRTEIVTATQIQRIGTDKRRSLSWLLALSQAAGVILCI